jgi:hypothetical protein
MENRPHTYLTLLRTYNRERPRERIVCDCGKTIHPKMLEKHQRTNIHKILTARKRLYEQWLINNPKEIKTEKQIILETIAEINKKLDSIQSIVDKLAS